MGRVVLEGRGDAGKAALYLQDVKSGAYRLVLLSKDGNDNRAVDVGGVRTCEKGTFEGKFELDRHAIASTNISLEKIDGAALILLKAPENYSEFSALLAGFKGEGYNWRENLTFPQFVKATEVQPNPPEPQQPEMQRPEPQELEPQPTEPIEMPAEPVQAQTAHHPEEVPPQAHPPQSFEHHHPPPPSQKPAAITQAAPIQAAQADAIGKLFTPQNIVDIFNNDQPQKEWITASLFDLHSLGLYNYSVKNNAFVVNNARQYKHVLLGRDEKGYTLGVPDILTNENSHKDGFKEFKPCNPDSNDNAHGYWMLPL